MVIPGSVLDQGTLPVVNGRFEYALNPKMLESRTATYDTVNGTTGRPEIGDVIHLTLLSREQAPGGAAAHSFRRIIIRGTKVISIK
jgi:hypothetical protein